MNQTRIGPAVVQCIGGWIAVADDGEPLGIFETEHGATVAYEIDRIVAQRPSLSRQRLTESKGRNVRP